MNNRPEFGNAGNRLIFVTGGAKSGKSSFALREAEKQSGRKAYIATAEALDEEMSQRIERHKRERGKEWETFEEPLLRPETIRRLIGSYKAILVDCLTLWLSNIISENRDAEDELDGLLDIMQQPGSATDVYIVSNEVGAGIVPENELARRFRDLAGTVNQKVAGVADEVYMVVAGIPVKIKG
jgi:adenosylcobinamide kinase / adenosylcobinamide-phosphate guanylyltransferase